MKKNENCYKLMRLLNLISSLVFVLFLIYKNLWFLVKYKNEIWVESLSWKLFFRYHRNVKRTRDLVI